jgi:hypothetical protein
MSVVLTEREVALAGLAAQMVMAALEAKDRPRVTGQEAAGILGICYPNFKGEHVEVVDIFYIPGTKRFWRADVLTLKRKREGCGL